MRLAKAVNKGKCMSNEVAKSPTLHNEHKHSHDKTIPTRTFVEHPRTVMIHI